MHLLQHQQEPTNVFHRPPCKRSKPKQRDGGVGAAGAVSMLKAAPSPFADIHDMCLNSELVRIEPRN